MAVKTFEVAEFGKVHITKRRGAKNVRLSIAAGGEIRVTIPAWTSYALGLEYIESQAAWLRTHAPAPRQPLIYGQRVGKTHRLVFSTGAVDKASSRINDDEVRVVRPHGMAVTHPDVQETARKACIRALRSEAEAILPKRLREIADAHGFTYSSVQIKQLRGRWGSCDAHKSIVFNLYLMQLPWKLIDYVILHELVHTKFLHHGADFWNEFLRCEKHAKDYRKYIKHFKPVLMSGEARAVVA